MFALKMLVEDSSKSVGCFGTGGGGTVIGPKGFFVPV